MNREERRHGRGSQPKRPFGVCTDPPAGVGTGRQLGRVELVLREFVPGQNSVEICWDVPDDDAAAQLCLAFMESAEKFTGLDFTDDDGE